MTTYKIYYTEQGQKWSTKLDKIADKARTYVYGGRGYSPSKFESQKYMAMIISFEKEVNKLKIRASLGDCLA